MSGPFDRLTDRAKQVLVAAKAEAMTMHQDYVGVEHLLVGLSQGDGVAAQVLCRVGLGENDIRRAVRFVVQSGERKPAGEPTLTRRAKRVVELAAEEARRFLHTHVGTEHLLLALLGDDKEVRDSVASRVLENLGVDAAEVRRQVKQVTQALTSSPEAPQPRGYVVTCRVDEQTLRALDELVEAGMHATRSEAAARLIAAGMRANQELLAKMHAAVAEIRRVREETRALAKQWRADRGCETADEAEADESRGGQVPGDTRRRKPPTG